MVRTVDSITAAVDELARRETAFAKVLDRIGHPEPRISDRGSQTLLRTIVGQQVSVAAARSMWNKLTARFGDPVDLAALSKASDEEPPPSKAEPVTAPSRTMVCASSKLVIPTL